MVRVERLKVLPFNFLGADEDLVRHCAQHIKQLFLLLLDLELGQENLCSPLLLHVEDYFGDNPCKNSQQNHANKVSVSIFDPESYLEAVDQNIYEAPHNEVEREV